MRRRPRAVFFELDMAHYIHAGIKVNIKDLAFEKTGRAKAPNKERGAARDGACM
jgi:hypothetical protein